MCEFYVFIDTITLWEIDWCIWKPMGILDQAEYITNMIIIAKMLNIRHMGPLSNALNKAGICQ